MPCHTTKRGQQSEAVLADGGVNRIDHHGVEEGIDGATKRGHCAHRSLKIRPFERDHHGLTGLRQRSVKGLFALLFQQSGVGCGFESAFAIFLFFRTQDVRRALGTRQQRLAILGVEELAEGLDATDKLQGVVMCP